MLTAAHLPRLHQTLVVAGVLIDGVDINGNVTPMALQGAAQPTIDAFDDSDVADAAYQNLHARGAATSALEADTSFMWKALRGAAAVLVDEINLLRQRDRDRAVDVAAATSLADLKSRWAARADLTDRTLAQAKTAIENKISAGLVD
jgi:hypothetical protein